MNQLENMKKKYEKIKKKLKKLNNIFCTRMAC